MRTIFDARGFGCGFSFAVRSTLREVADRTDNMEFQQVHPVQRVHDGTASEWVDEAAHRAERTEAKPRSWLNYPATYALVAVNVLVFLAMFSAGPVPGMVRQHAWGGIATAAFDVPTLLRFGGSDSILILQGQWWRLLTAAFVHASILHIALNMWCLWNLGLFGEPLLGKPGLVSVYVLTGVAGNLLSLSWSVFTRMDSVVVGASGAVFGVAGILIVLLSNRGLAKPGLRWEEIRGLRSQVILFAAANLFLGVAPNFVPLMGQGALHAMHVNADNLPRIDNSAHLGGFLCGLVLGLPLFSRMTAGKSAYRARQRVAFTVAALLLAMFGYAISRFA
jgi:rhomboid protease GluP